MRAVLLASATATTRPGHRARRASTHRALAGHHVRAGDQRDVLRQSLGAERRDEAELGGVSAPCVRRRRLLTRQQRPGAVEHRHGLLVDALDRHEAHGWPTHRLADRLGVGRVVLVPLEARLHMAWRHQLHLAAQRDQLARLVMGRASRLHAAHLLAGRLHADQHGASPSKKASSLSRRIALRITTRPRPSMACWKTVFARSRPIVVTCCLWTLPLPWRSSSTTTLWHRCRRVAGVHTIIPGRRSRTRNPGTAT